MATTVLAMVASARLAMAGTLLDVLYSRIVTRVNDAYGLFACVAIGDPVRGAIKASTPVQADIFTANGQYITTSFVGFRLTGLQAVPEPSTIVSMFTALGFSWIRIRRGRSS